MGKGIGYLVENHDVKELPEPFPCFLNQRPVWRFCWKWLVSQEMRCGLAEESLRLAKHLLS